MSPLTHAFDDKTIFREYEPHELKQARYPHVWDKLDEPRHTDVLDAADMILPGGVKDVVRHATGERCERCRHPYRPGFSEWAPKDPAIRPEFRDGASTGLTADVQLMFHASELIAGYERDGGPGYPTVTDRDRAEREDHWSPCDARCTHPGPFRTRRRPHPDVGPCFGWTTYRADAPDAGERVRSGLETQAAWRILTVHHLNERKHDLRWWNLAALCQRCHLVIQRKVTMDVPWPWEHSTWFQPHAAAWYALKFLGEHLTYTETMGRLDELLALGVQSEATERMAL